MIKIEFSFPHARGDGPQRGFLPNDLVGFSPRPWGWSEAERRIRDFTFVFPTPVGMVRLNENFSETEKCFPHARGDGPLIRVPTVKAPVFSPRPWGWSVDDQLTVQIDCVFPTPVGMVRLPAEQPAIFAGFPHARGDGPKNHPRMSNALQFSPRPWGWSVFRNVPFPLLLVFPTPVGMVRTAATTTSPRATATVAMCFPHARGDGPGSFDPDSVTSPFSPRPWGWSGLTKKQPLKL